MANNAFAEWPEPLSKADKYREATFIALVLVDWRQSSMIPKYPDKWAEQNPLLPYHPSQHQINNTAALGAVVHAVITYALPVRFRPAWQYVTIGAEASNVGRNAYIGMRIAY